MLTPVCVYPTVRRSQINMSDVGIHVNYSTTLGGIVLHNNHEPAGVPSNYNPYIVHNYDPYGLK